MRVSVVVPTHRRADLLRAALDSVAAQTLQPAEVLVVDDADDPATTALARDLREGGVLPVRTVAHPAGTGVSSSRNAGARAAGGDVLAFLDDDDIWRPRHLQSAIAELERTGVQVVFTHLVVVRDGQSRGAFAVPPGLRVADVVARNPGVTGSNMVLRRETFERVGGFDESLWVSNDKDFLVRLLASGATYGVVPEPLVEKREHRGERLTTDGGRHAAGLRRYYAKHEARLRPRDRRFLRFQIERSLRAATRGGERLRHTARLLPLLGGAQLLELVESAQRRVGRA